MEVPSLVKKIAIVGPESTGKSTLAEALAQHYQTVWVPEYARGYLSKLGREYDQSDLIKIAHGQLRLEDEWINDANRFLFCDTNLVVIKIWSEFKYGTCAPEILQRMQERKYDLHLLTNIDLPWEADPQREHPDKRMELFNLYETELKNQKLPFIVIHGQQHERLQHAINGIDSFISLS
jgi:NadR type nicotinamide-nucleotide adenylyltransferase